MRCASCNGDNPGSARFCATCGTRLGLTCAHCGAEVFAASRFCMACGEPLEDADADRAAAEATGEAERRRISVLFVDLVNFTSLAEAMDPEDVRRVQSRYFEAARSVVATYGGMIEKFIGDAVMAVWGAPVAHEDDAERAVRAALAVVYAVDRLGGAAGSGLKARAAVTTGEAAVTVGARGQGMVAGDLVNVAARLQGRAPVGGVLVDETTRERGGGAVTFTRVGSMALKGRAGRPTVYRAVEVLPGPMARIAGGHTGPFVGRERELAELTGLVTAMLRDRRSRLVSITGIAGMGKSRLVWELANWIDGLDDDFAWHEGRSPAYGEGVAFAPVTEMLRRRARIDDATPPALALRQLGAAIRDFVDDEEERRWIEPRLATLLGGEGVTAFDRDELFAAWRRFFERVADRMPVVLVFEDLHWADPSLIGFIEHLATWARQRPILVVALARPELLDRFPSWGAGLGSFTAIHLEPMDDASLRELLESRGPRLPRGLARRVLDHAGGVPLYAVEVARMLEQGEEDGDGAGAGADRRRRTRSLATSGSGLEVPDTLHGLIAARIDALPGDERRLLHAASVLGRRFRPETLITIAGGDAGATRERVDALVRRELLTLDEELNSPGRGELRFVQDVVREVAYHTLGRSERRAIHLDAAHVFEAMGEEATDALAAHLAEAHDLTTDAGERQRLARRAVAAQRHAARGAMLLHAPERALGLLERALRIRGDADDRAPILNEAAEAARAAGRLEVAEEHLRELLAIEVAGGADPAAARTRARLASVLLTAQRNEPALAELEEAMRDVHGWEGDPIGVELAAQLARARLLTGDDAEALAWADRALDAASSQDLAGVATDVLVTRGTARLSLGDDDAGLADLRDAIERASEAGSLRTELRARNNLAWGLLDDDPRAAMTIARQGFDLATAMGIGDAAVPLADIACTVAVETGEWGWALGAIDELEERGSSDSFRIVLAATASVIRTLRADPEPMRAIDLVGPLAADTDSQVVAAVDHARAWAAFTRADFAEARRMAEAAVAGYVGSDPALQRALATRACLWLGDRGAARDGVELLASTLRHGRAASATVETMRAGVDALEGKAEAAEGYGRAVEAWTALGLPLQRVLCLLDRARLLGVGADEARAAVDELGAGGLRGLAELAGDPAAIGATEGRPRRARAPRSRAG